MPVYLFNKINKLVTVCSKWLKKFKSWLYKRFESSGEINQTNRDCDRVSEINQGHGNQDEIHQADEKKIDQSGSKREQVILVAVGEGEEAYKIDFE